MTPNTTARTAPTAAPALRLDGEPVDPARFYAAACDPRRSVVVEACAGSGKTWMLVSRMVRALLDGATPDQVLAVTFTRAAAAEMRDRLVAELSDLAAPRASHDARVAALRSRGLDAAEAEALAPALGALRDRVFRDGRPLEVHTFHAWFARLVRQAPLALQDAAGFPADAVLVDDWREHHGRILRDFHARVVADEALAADLREMTRRRGREMLKGWLVAALEKRIELEMADAHGALAASVEPATVRWPGLAAFDHPGEQARTLPFRAAANAALQALLQSPRKPEREQGAKLAAALDLDDPAARTEAMVAALYRQDGGRRSLGSAPAVGELQERVGLLAEQAAQHDAHIEHGAMVRLSRALFAALDAYKRARGLADMADLERAALVLLTDDRWAGWVQERLDTSIRHVLVDEFQDTSPLQWQALHAWLSAYVGAGGGASGQRPPAVFIVGDPKQSIYGFRRADPRVFAAAAAFVRDGLGGRLLACDHTRRCAPAIVEALNRVFVPLAFAGEFPDFRPHTTEVAERAGDAVRLLAEVPAAARKSAPSASATAPASRRDVLLTPRDAVARPTGAEPRAVATAVREEAAALAASGGPPPRVFVLCRRREPLGAMAAALARLDVAHRATDDSLLRDAPEVADLVALVDALVSPRHRLSLAQALKSPVFGLDDAALLAIAGRAAEARVEWLPALATLAGEPGAAAPLVRAHALLDRWRDAADALPPHDLLDRILDEGDVVRRVVASVRPEQRRRAVDAIRALTTQALRLDGGRHLTPYAFVRAMRSRELHVPPVVAGVRAGPAVELLTVHGAKGLEADAVLVVDTDALVRGGQTKSIHVEWPVDARHPVRAAFLWNPTAPPPSLREAVQAQQAADRREHWNALYVAMTRARRRLVFSATAASGSPKSDAWWRVVSAVLPAAATEAAPVTAPTVAESASVRTLPRLDRPAVAPATVAAETSTAARIGRAVHRTLEWIGNRAAPTDRAGRARLADAAAVAFEAPVGAVRRSVDAILDRPALAAFFDRSRHAWSGNEVSLGVDGEVIRLDRLVRFRDDDREHRGAWWVLDWKLGHDAEATRARHGPQLARYRAALAAAEPGATVHAAFVTGDGVLVPLEAPPAAAARPASAIA